MTAPSGLTYTTNPADYQERFAISPNRPSITGGDPPTVYSVSPSLPDGLLLDKVTGVISGKLRQGAGQTDYTVTAANIDGSTDCIVSLGSEVSPPIFLSYPNNSHIFCFVGVDTATLPNITGEPTNWTINSPISAYNLTLDAASGLIWGTPISVLPSTDFLVTASNAAGATTTKVTIEISPAS